MLKALALVSGTSLWAVVTSGVQSECDNELGEKRFVLQSIANTLEPGKTVAFIQSSLKGATITRQHNGMLTPVCICTVTLLLDS